MTATVSTAGAPRIELGPARPTTAHDGDTFRCALDMGALIPGAKAWEEDVRLAHVNAAELSTAEGRDALVAVRAWLDARPSGTLRVWGREKYGRLLADYVAGGESLADYVATLAGTRPMALSKQLAP